MRGSGAYAASAARRSGKHLGLVVIIAVLDLKRGLLHDEVHGGPRGGDGDRSPHSAEVEPAGGRGLGRVGVFMSVHSCAEDVQVGGTGDGGNVYVVIGHHAKIQVGVVRRQAMNGNVRGHDEEQHEKEDDGANAASDGEAGAVIESGLERARWELDLGGQVCTEGGHQGGQTLGERRAWWWRKESNEELALEHRGRRSDDDGR